MASDSEITSPRYTNRADKETQKSKAFPALTAARGSGRNKGSIGEVAALESQRNQGFPELKKAGEAIANKRALDKERGAKLQVERAVDSDTEPQRSASEEVSTHGPEKHRRLTTDYFRKRWGRHEDRETLLSDVHDRSGAWPQS